MSMAAAAEAMPQKATDTTASLDEPKSLVEASLTDCRRRVPPEAPSVERTQASTPDPAPEKAADTTAGMDEPKPYVVASLTDPSQVFPPEADGERT